MGWVRWSDVMKMNAALLAAAVVVSAGAWSMTARGDDALDLGLGPKEGAKPAEVKPLEGTTADKAPKTDVKTEEKAGAKKEEPAAPGGEQLVSPDAAKKVDDQDLLKKLTGEDKTAEGPPDPNEKFQKVIGRMDESEKLLKAKETGDVTQETQRRIVMDLDVLIEIAKKMQQQSSSSSSSQKPGQQRQESKANQPGKQSQGGTTAAQQSVLPSGTAGAAQSNGTDIHEKSKEWGGLPDRDRDLISHGANEQYLPAYKEQIEKYYEALAEIGKAAKER